MRDVAERAGVAISSVSRVLSDHPDVSDRTRDKVMKAVKEIGYRPNLLAQGLRSQRTLTVGFALSDIANPVLSDAVTGAEVELRNAGYGLLVTDAEGDPELDAANIALLDQRQVDGVLLSLSDERHAGTVAALRDARGPLVLLDRDAPEGVTAHALLFDHRSGMRAAAEHLRELGHTDVALLIGGPRRPARERHAGLVDVFGEEHCEVLEGEFSIAHGEAAMTELLGRPSPPTAVIAAGNLLMHGTLRAVRAAGAELGADVSLVGCDDVAVAEFHSPPIALVKRDTRRIGIESARLLLRDLAGEEVGEPPPLPTTFVAAASCAPPR